MTPDEYKKVRAIFHGAWERPPGERTAFLDGACGSNSDLRAQVESLLATAQQGDQFMAGTAAQAVGISRATLLQPPDALPASIARYRVVRLLGEGGMGSAYEAQQENPARRVAVKTIRPGLGTPTMLRRFAHEAHILGRLRHPGIAQVYEAGVAEGPVGPIPFIAMELVAGVPLDSWARRHNPARHERIELLATVCDAVQHAHGNGVIHRDLKPGNILVEARDGPATSRWAPRILDFGVARLIRPDGAAVPTLATDPGTLIGTLAYMSPEQVSAGPEGVDARADVYALGVLLFELLTSRLPRDIDGKAIAEAARIIRDEEPLRARAIDPSLRGDLDTICAKALAREPARRYQTAAELATDLRRFLTDEPIIARPATVMYQARKFARRHRGLVTGLCAAGVVLILGVASTIWYAIAATRQRTRALQQEAAAQWTTYKLSVGAVEESIGRFPGRALAQLQGAPPAHRNWEWRHLMAALDPPTTTVDCDLGVKASGTFMPDGSARAAVVHADRLEVIDIASGSLVASFPAPSGLTGTALSAGVLATYDRDPARVTAYDVASHAKLLETTFDGGTELIGLSPDASLLGVVVWRRGIFILDTATGRERTRFEFDVASAGYGTLAFSTDNRRMLCTASGSTDGARVAIYDLAGSTPPRTVEEAFVAAFDPSSPVFATGTIKGIRLRDAGTLELRSEIHGQFRETLALAFSGDGTRLVGFVGRSAIHVWSTDTRELELAINAPPGPHSMTTDVAGARALVCSPGHVTVLPLTDCSTRVLQGHTSYVYSVAWSGDGAMVASAGWDGSVRVWDAATGEPRAVIAVQPPSPLAPVTAISFTRDEARLLVVTHAGDLFEFDLRDSARSAGPTIPLPPPSARDEAALSNYWAWARGGAKRVYNAGGERMSSSVDAKLLATPDSGAVLITDLASGVQRLRLEANHGVIYATAFSPDHIHLATAGEARSVRLWDLRSGAMTAELGDHGCLTYTICFSPDGTRMATGDANGLIFLWDTARNEKVAELRGHTSYVHSLAFSPDGNTLCSGSGDGTVRLWLTSRR